MSNLPGVALPYLEMQISEVDLSEIAEYIPEWEWQLAPRLNLTEVGIRDIKAMYQSPLMQRYN